MPAPSSKKPGLKRPRRNRSYVDTHAAMIRVAVNLIAEKGVESLSIAQLARALGINRTTVYYHFESREKLIEEVIAYSSDQLASAFRPDRPREDRIDHIYRFVLENPELLKIWLGEFLATRDIRQMYPHWDELVEGVSEQFAGDPATASIDAEIFCVNLLTSAFIGPQVFKSSVCPELSNEEIIARFKAESLRMLAGISMAWGRE